MKKLSFLLVSLLVALLLCLTACDGTNPDNTPDKIPDDVPNETPDNPDNPDNPENPPEHTHAFGEWTVTKPATCGDSGSRERACECDEVEIEAIPPTEEHTVVTDAAIEATCTESGLTEGSHCSACGNILVKQHAVDIKPHDLDENGVCTFCHDSFLVTEGVIYELSEDGSYASVVGYEGDDERIVIDNDYNGVPVKSIGDFAFEFSSLTSVVIPSTVTRIGDSAFAYCDALTAVEIPVGVTHIGNDAFWGCGALLSVSIPNTVTVIGNDAFSECSSLVSVVIPDSVTSLGEYVFYRCSSLKSVVIGNGVKILGDCAFFYCKSLESVLLPAGLVLVKSEVFFGCSALSDLYYGGSETDWSAINFDEGNDLPATVKIHFNCIFE